MVKYGFFGKGHGRNPSRLLGVPFGAAAVAGEKHSLFLSGGQASFCTASAL
jgi:hypothetical protein